jgi:ELWxxDGT repeat protein
MGLLTLCGGRAAAGGPAAGTVAMVRDVDPSKGSGPAHLTRVGDHVFLVANDGTTGRELWMTDGSDLHRVRDIRPGRWGPHLGWLTALGSRLLFVADDGVQGPEPWTSDDTRGGTHLVRDLAPGAAGSFPDALTRAAGAVFFTRGQGGPELWRTDGSAAGTRRVLALPPDRAKIFDPTRAGSWLYFVVERWRPGVPGSERFSLWRSRGTAATTRRIAGLSGEYELGSLAGAGGAVYLATGGQPWTSDGTGPGTHVLRRIDSEGDIEGFVASGGRVFFTAHRFDTDVDDDAAGLWVTDGTARGTRLLRIFGPSPRGTRLPASLTDVGGTLFFAADDTDPTGDGTGSELWSSDGTRAGTGGVQDIADPGGSDPGSLLALDGVLFFAADDAGAGDHGRELWRDVGTHDGARLEADIDPSGDSDPTELTRLGASFVFVADDGVHGRELWRWSPS